MKFLGKFGIMLAAFAMVISFGILSPSIAVVASSTNYLGNTLSISDVQTSFDNEDVITAGEYTGVIIPNATSSSGAVVITAKNSAGQNYSSFVHQGVSYEGNTINMFCPTKRLGAYILSYSVTSADNVVTSRDVTITFEGYVPSFNFPTNANANEIIPSKVNPGTTLNFAYPDISLADDNETIISADITHGDDTSGGVTTITLINPNSENVTLTGDDIKSYTIPETDTIYGNYTVTYQFTSTDGYVISKSFTINVVKTTTFDPDDIELAIQSFSSSTDDINLELGVVTTFPTATVVNSNADDEAVAVHTDIKIEYLNEGTYTTEATVNDYMLTPTKAGQYRITYIVTDFFGHTLSQALNQKTASLTSNSLNVKMVNAYSTDDVVTMKDNYKDLVNTSYNVPTKVATGSIFTLPAIFGTGFGAYADLNFTRSYTINGSKTVVSAAANETFNLTFTKSGTYSINYSVCYASDTTKSISLSTVKVSVVDNFTHTVAPEVTLSGAPNSINKGETFELTLTANDYDDEGVNLVDTNLEKNVIYSYSTQPSVLYNATLNDNGYYEIEVSKTTDASSITVYANAKNDFGNTGTSDELVVFINDNSTDILAPTIATNTSNIFDADWGEQIRGSVIEIPGVSIDDATSNVKLQISISCDGTLTGEKFTKFASSNTLTTIDGEFSFTLSKKGTYSITYVATDANDNMSVLAIEVNSNSDAQPSIKMNLNATAEYGQTINLYSGITTYLSGDIVRYTPSIVTLPAQLADETSTDYATRVNAFVANILDNATDSTLLIGIYGNPAEILNNQSIVVEDNISVRAWAVNVSAGFNYYNIAGSNLVSIAVSDTADPTFSIVGGEAKRQQQYFTTIPTGSTSTLEELNTVTIPWFDAATLNDDTLGYTGSGVNLSTLKIVVKYADSDDALATFTYLNADETNSVVATKNGKINATYSVEDYAGNTTTKSITFEIGDVTAPEISLGDIDLTVSKEVGNKLTVDLSEITITEDVDDMDYSDLDITVTCDGAEVNPTIEDDTLTLDLDTAGTYIIKFSCTDSAGNTSEVITRTFNVTEASTAAISSTTIWGTVLIVLALLILGGVIYFFVKPSKTKVSLTTTTKK